MGTNSRACEDTSRAWNCNIVMRNNPDFVKQEVRTSRIYNFDMEGGGYIFCKNTLIFFFL